MPAGEPESAWGDVKLESARAAGRAHDYRAFLSSLSNCQEGDAASDIFIMLSALGKRSKPRTPGLREQPPEMLSMSKYSISSLDPGGSS